MDQETNKLLKKGAIEVVEHSENQFLSNVFTVPKKDGTRRPVIDIRQLNQFVKKSSIQDGRFDSTTISPLEGGLSLQDRSSGRLPDDPCCKESKSVPAVSLERETLPVHLPALRTGFLIKNIYQMPKATANLSSGSCGASAGLSGQYPNNGSYKGAMFGTGPANHRIIGEAR